MKTASHFALVFVLVVAISVDAQNVLKSCAPISVVATDTLWSEEEAVLACAVAIRAKVLENQTGIKFGDNWAPKVSIQWSLGSDMISQIAGEYRAENETLYFSVLAINSISEKYKTPLRLIDPEVVANDEGFSMLADHELGHELADIVSRRSGFDPFYTVLHFNSLPFEERFGLKTVSEGVGMFFSSINHKMFGEALGPLAFPGSLDDYAGISGDMIAYQGGYWLVKDVMTQHGERGLVWLVSHPFYLGIAGMRDSAISYRKRALDELAN